MPNIECGNKDCPGPPHVVAIYKHDHAGAARRWTVDPAVGPDPKGVPQPQPCPDDAVACTVESWLCMACGTVKP